MLDKTTAKLTAEIPRILALKKMGCKPAEIARLVGVSAPTLKKFCRECPDLQDVCANKKYRCEYVAAKLFLDFKAGKLSERGALKFLEILLSSQLLDLRKHLMTIEIALKVNGILPTEDRLEVEGVSEADIERVMQLMTRRGNRDGGNRKLFEGQSDYIDHYEIVPKNNLSIEGGMD